jgi:hypothetical protein
MLTPLPKGVRPYPSGGGAGHGNLEAIKGAPQSDFA